MAFLGNRPITPEEMSAKEKIKEFKKFIRKANPDTLQVLLATPIPGTGLYERLQKQGRIYSRSIVSWENYDGGHLCFRPDAPMEAEEVQQDSIKIMKWFYSGWNLWKIPLMIFAFPFVVRNLTPALRSIRPRIRQAAAVLGASPETVLRFIDIPMIGRAIFVAAIFAFTISLGTNFRESKSKATKSRLVP